ncbi:hypothetical protein JCM8115_002051 [Rhodotorula mucilaginosa]
MSGGRHRTPASDMTLKGDIVLDFPSSITTATRRRESTPTTESVLARNRRQTAAGTDAAEVDIWVESRDSYVPLLPSSSNLPSPSESEFAPFVMDPPPSPPPKDIPPAPTISTLPSKGGFYSKSTSIAQARSHKSLKQLQGMHDHRQQPTRPLNWRDKGQEMARLRKKSATSAGLGLSIQQIIGTAATIAILTLGAVVYVSSRGKSAVVKHMQRREQILAASLAPTSSSISHHRPPHMHESFRDELSTDAHYVLSVPHGDFAEQTMNLYHLTHLSTAMHRIPIAHPFLLPDPKQPGVLSEHAVPTIYDLARFAAGTSVSILDWNDLRPHETGGVHKVEQLGCWVGEVSAAERADRVAKMQSTGLAPGFVPVRLKLGASEAGQGDDLKETHGFLARFDKDLSAQTGLIEQARHIAAAGLSKHDAVPEDQVFCIDHTLYRPEHPTTKHSTTHLDPRDHTAFFKHGRHLHFAPEIHETAGEIVAHLLGHKHSFLAVHISASARASECKLLDEPDRCEANLLDYQRAVGRVKHVVAQTAGRKNRENRHAAKNLSVVVSTDIKDLAFLGELANLGWTVLDYDDLEIRERFGRWDPQLMDQAIESRASGFVGTRGSAQSTISALRVRTWRSGPTELI